MNEVRIFIEDNGNRNYEDTNVLLEELKEYDVPRKIILQLSDIEGQVVTGRCCSVVGVLENGEFLLSGNIDGVVFKK